ncbi:acyl-CoA N-acyltransferase [Hyaloscypha variabilis]
MAPKSDTLGAVTLTSATLDDVPALIEIHTSAFKSDLFSSLMLSNRPEDAHQVLMRKSVDNWMEDSCAQIIKAVDTDERVLGWACWILKPAQIVALSVDQNLKDTASTETTSQNPKKKTTQQESDPTRVLGGLMHAEAVKWQNKYLNGKRYMVLQALATHPSSQGHGIGTKLVQWGVDKADSEGLVCWAHASPSGHFLYRNNGFEEVGRSEFDLGKWVPDEMRGEREWAMYTFRYMLRPAINVT